MTEWATVVIVAGVVVMGWVVVSWWTAAELRRMRQYLESRQPGLDQLMKENRRLQAAVTYMQNVTQVQVSADGFQDGWHAALKRIGEGDTPEALRNLVPVRAPELTPVDDLKARWQD